MDIVHTCVAFPYCSSEVWEGLKLYEEIERPAPILIRWTIPRAIRIEGRKSHVGDCVTCLYESGILVKEITDVDLGRRYAFDVVQQSINLHGVALVSGEYRLLKLSAGCTDVFLVTRYRSHRRPRWFWRLFETTFCHAFHRHILAVLLDSLDKAAARRLVS